MFGDFDFQVIFGNLDILWDGMLITLLLTAVAIVGGILFGTVLALMRLSRFTLLSILAGRYVDAFRSTPLILVIFWFYFAMPIIGLEAIGGLGSVLIAFTLVGSFVPRAYVFDMGIAIIFGIIGYIARRTGYHVAAILIGVILGPLLENYFLRALRISQGDLTTLFSSNIGNTLWMLLVLSLIIPGLKRYRSKTSVNKKQQRR